MIAVSAKNTVTTENRKELEVMQGIFDWAVVKNLNGENIPIIAFNRTLLIT